MSTTDKHKQPSEPQPPKNEPAVEAMAPAPKPELTREQLEELRRKLQKKFHS